VKNVTGKELAKALEKKGWQLRNIKGSHHVYTKPGQSYRISVPIHKSQPLKPGLLNKLAKMAGLTEEDI